MEVSSSSCCFSTWDASCATTSAICCNSLSTSWSSKDDCLLDSSRSNICVERAAAAAWRSRFSQLSLNSVVAALCRSLCNSKAVSSAFERRSSTSLSSEPRHPKLSDIMRSFVARAIASERLLCRSTSSQARAAICSAPSVAKSRSAATFLSSYSLDILPMWRSIFSSMCSLKARNAASYSCWKSPMQKSRSREVPAALPPRAAEIASQPRRKTACSSSSRNLTSTSLLNSMSSARTACIWDSVTKTFLEGLWQIWELEFF
mmetsp:Transcript_63603/g.99048  ORF Transcript_63603/g.99048 Transcript_63603/m.99048 type:complete len:261 (+) Transcript_63603:293-1075(+)